MKAVPVTGTCLGEQQIDSCGGGDTGQLLVR